MYEIDVINHNDDLKDFLILDISDRIQMTERFHKTFVAVDNQPKDLAWCKWYQCYADGMKIRGE